MPSHRRTMPSWRSSHAARRLLLSILFLVAGPACGGSVEVSVASTGSSGDPGGGGMDAGGSLSSSSNGGAGAGATGSGGSSTGVGGAGGFCADACAMTADACFSPSTCVEYCEARALAWPDAVRKAFADCAANEPLCFQTMDGCMLGKLYPPEALKTVRLTGKGFDTNEGMTVHVWHDPGAGVPFGGQAVITGGAFAFDWMEPGYVSDTGGPLLLLYIDVDGDDICKAAADLTAAANTSWNGDFLAPVFEAVLTPPLADPDFVCDFPP